MGRRAGRLPRADGRHGAPFVVPPGWRLDPEGKTISRRLKTRDFLEALSILNEVAGLAERLQHHPDLHLERWNLLRIATYSHDVGRLTERDERLALALNDLLARRGFPAG